MGLQGPGRLEELGARISIGQAPINIPSDCDLVVFSRQFSRTTPSCSRPSAAESRAASMPKCSVRSCVCARYRHRGNAWQGTTTALTAYILRQAKADPTYVVGADVRQLGSSAGVGDGDHFVVEACEFDRSFLQSHAHIRGDFEILRKTISTASRAWRQLLRRFKAFASPGATRRGDPCQY